MALAAQQFIGPVKVAIFMDLVGKGTEPLAKSLVLVVLVPVLVVYNVLVSLITSPQRLVLAVCGFYGVLNLLIALVHRSANGHPGKWLAWILYYATETRGVIIMPMIWSVIADVTPPDVAKKAYPIIFFSIQMGGILGSFVAIQVTDLGGEIGLLLMHAVSFAFVASFSVFACELAQADDGTDAADGGGDVAASFARGRDSPLQTDAPVDDVGGSRSSFIQALTKGLEQISQGFEGLWLLLSRPYVFMCFWVSYASLMPRTVLDYQNSVLGVEAHDSRDAQIAFFGRVNMCINVGTAALALFGTRSIVERLGVGGSLAVLPVCMALCVWSLCINYNLVVSTVSLVLVCIVAYGLNSPSKEMLYARTSREIKYKAKSWSEMYGNQVMKLLGAQVNLWVNREVDACSSQAAISSCFHANATAVVSGAWIALWFAVALRLGSEHRSLELKDEIVS